MLWNGQFGGKGTNAGTESNWTANTPKEINNLGYEGVEIQAIAGFNVHRLKIDSSFLDTYPEYKQMLDDAFPTLKVKDRYSNIGVGLSIAAYERTLLPTQSPFQKWLNGRYDAMTDQQKIGAVLFFGKAKCASCHTGPALNSMEFHALGMKDLDAEKTTSSNPGFNAAVLGRGGFTGNTADEYKFKVPQLYNLRDSPFYGHGSSFSSVKDVVEYKNLANAENSIVPTSQLASDFTALGLTDQEVEDITVFIEDALYDDNLQRFVPSTVLSGNCFPVSDDAAKMDLGCE